jgi:hypothetical protein
MSFALTPLSGFGGRATTLMAFEVAGSDQSTAAGTTYTFTAVNIGTAATGRRVLVAMVGSDNGVSMAISSVTIGGNPATIVAQSTINVSTNQAAFACLQVDTGTTADIVVTCDADGSNNMQIQVYALYGLSSSTPNDTYIENGTTATVTGGTIDCPAGGAIFGVVGWRDVGVATSTTWTLTTEVSDAYYDGVISYSHAYQSFPSAQTGLSVTATASQSGSYYAHALVSYG